MNHLQHEVKKHGRESPELARGAGFAAGQRLGECRSARDLTGLFISAVVPLVMTRQLSLLETRVLGVLWRSSARFPTRYPLTLNALVSGCNQKTSRDPVMEVTRGAGAGGARQPEERTTW